MPIVMISRGSYTRGGEVAALVAQRLGYRCLSREVLLEAATQYHLPETKLIEAVDGAVTFLDRLTGGRERYVACIRAALLQALVPDNVVYHGFAGHFLVTDVAHVLKVRIEADLDHRVALVMERDGVSPEEARTLIARLDRERASWSHRLYGIDSRDARLYDLVLQVGRLTVADAAELIGEAVRRPQFRSTPASRERLEDLALAARVHGSLAELTTDVDVVSSRGQVTIRTLPQLASSAVSAAHVARLARSVAGVSSVVIEGTRSYLASI